MLALFWAMGLPLLRASLLKTTVSTDTIDGGSNNEKRRERTEKQRKRRRERE